MTGKNQGNAQTEDGTSLTGAIEQAQAEQKPNANQAKAQAQKPMAKKGDESTISGYLNSLADCSPQELEAAKTRINSILSGKRKQKIKDSRKLVVITDFYDSRVKPFAGGVRMNGFTKMDGQAVYSLTAEDGETTIMNGAKIKTYFSNRIDRIHKFENKETGPSITLEHNEKIWDINFEFYAIGNLAGENIKELLAQAV